MKKIVLIMFLFVILFMGEAKAVVCCQESPEVPQRKCWTEGECCLKGTPLEYWATSCYQFKLWVEPKSKMFTVGIPMRVNLYLENAGAYQDDFNITYVNDNPDLVKVLMPEPHLIDNPESTNTTGIYPDEKILIMPRVLVLSNTMTGQIVFSGISQTTGTEVTDTLTILESEFLLSLPEFGLLALISMILLAGIFFSLKI